MLDAMTACGNRICILKPVYKRDEAHSSGSWVKPMTSVDGLAAFLGVLKSYLPIDLYQVAEAGFFHNYLATDCWLRKLISPAASPKSEREIRNMLASLH